MKTINDFIEELKSISEDKKKLPLIIKTPNGQLFEPKIKMIFKDDNFITGEVIKMIITY